MRALHQFFTLRKLVTIQYWYTAAYNGRTEVHRELEVRTSVVSKLVAAAFFAICFPRLVPRQFRLWLANLVARAIIHGEFVRITRLSPPELCIAGSTDATILQEDMRFVHRLILSLSSIERRYNLPTIRHGWCELKYKERYAMGFAGEPRLR